MVMPYDYRDAHNLAYLRWRRMVSLLNETMPDEIEGWSRLTAMAQRDYLCYMALAQVAARTKGRTQ